MGVIKREDYAVLLEDEETTGGGLALAGWGMTTVSALVLGFASWQYAPPRSAPTELARVDANLPDPSEVTGSIGVGERSGGSVGVSRVVGAAKVAPMPLASNETVATSRDIEQLRIEIKELQRRLQLVGQAGDGVGRRIDRLEEKMAGDQAAVRERLASLQAPASAPVTIAAGEPSGETSVAGRFPVPAPRPIFDPAFYTGTIAARPNEASPVAVAAPGAPSAPAAPEAAPKSARSVMPPPAEAAHPAEARVPPAVPHVAPEASPATPAPQANAPQAASPQLPPPQAAMVTASIAPSAASGEVAALDLGGYRSLASLKKAWGDMTGRYGEFGAKMEPLARLRETETGMEARLLAGPYPSQTEAAKSCMRLKALGVGCAVTSYTGQPLGAAR